MEPICNGQESEPPAVFEIIGEPAIVINGIPNLPPGAAASSHQDMMNTAGLDKDPCVGEWLEGRRIRKLFGDRYYSGKVEKYDREANWYRVTYEDGDFEDLEWHELEEVLLPLDISIPLTTLALERCECGNLATESGSTKSRTRKNHTKSVGSMAKTLKVLRTSQMSLPEVGQLFEVVVRSEGNLHETMRRQEVQVGDRETSLHIYASERSLSKPESDIAKLNDSQHVVNMVKASEPLRWPPSAKLESGRLIEAKMGTEAMLQEALKRQKEAHKQITKTARAEKQEKRDICSSCRGS